MEEQVKPKRNYWKLWGIVALIIFLIVGGYFGYNYLAVKFYNQGYVLGTFYTAQTGEIRYINNETKKEEAITLIKYWQQNCQKYIETNLNCVAKVK